jgi:hypothetical protein
VKVQADPYKLDCNMNHTVHNFYFKHPSEEKSPQYLLDSRIGGTMLMDKRSFPPPAKIMLQPHGSCSAAIQYAASHIGLRFSQQ